jgi:hypothetical protein
MQFHLDLSVHDLALFFEHSKQITIRLSMVHQVIIGKSLDKQMHLLGHLLPQLTTARTLFGYIIGLGGRDVKPDLIRGIAEKTLAADKPEREDIWVGVKE